MPEYVELHCHSNFSFQEGASTIEQLVVRASDLGYPALALTDHDNLSAAMRFSRKARRRGLHPITGAEVTLAIDGEPTHITLLVETQTGYKNLCNLLSLSRLESDRRYPTVRPDLLARHAEGLILLSGCARGPISRALEQGRLNVAEDLARQYLDWFGENNFFLELQQNLVYGDSARIKQLSRLGQTIGVPVVATNNAHYHIKDRHRLQDCLVSIQVRKTLEQSHRDRRANAEFYLKSPDQMARLFREIPDSIHNTLEIAGRCNFDITTQLTYKFPRYAVPDGYDQLAYLNYLCRDAAQRKYGRITPKVESRLREEMRRIEKHDLSGLLLIYHEIITVGREVQIDLGLVDPETPLEEAPPGRGRGSSVAILVGYLLGISHIDPLKYDLGLDRFLPEELVVAPDIDLDFPRNIREELIKRIHERYGWDHAALTGAFPTYKIRGAIRDIGMVLGLPQAQLSKLSIQTEHASAQQVRDEMLAMPDFRDKVDSPIWRDLVELSKQLDGFPRGISQHPSGMLLSSTPLSDQVPVHQSAMDGRYITQWDKHSAEDAKFVKIDILALGALSQMQDALRLIEQRTGESIDLSRIDFEDHAVYQAMHRGDTVGIFQIESAAQMQTIIRIKPKNLVDMAHEVAAVRPGVGANDGVSEYIRRRKRRQVEPGWPIPYEHISEEPALERTLGMILFQDQFNELAIQVAGFTPTEAEEFRRAYSRPDENEDIASYWWPKFRDGAHSHGVNGQTAARIFKKFNGQYMFPEAHAYAFGVTAYQMAWLKYHYPLEFFVGLFNEQPMGFYNIETLKEDAKRHGVLILKPDANLSREQCLAESNALRLGLLNVAGISRESAKAIVAERDQRGSYRSIEDLMERNNLLKESLENLAGSGALDSLSNTPRRAIQWEVGLRSRPKRTVKGPSHQAQRQVSLPLPVEHDMVPLVDPSAWEQMIEEYRTLGLHPSSHLMAYIRDRLSEVTTTDRLWELPHGTVVQIAGLVIRRQRPLAKTYFITLEDEFGHAPVAVRPEVYKRYRTLLREPILKLKGVVTHREGTMNVVVHSVETIDVFARVTPKAKNWN